MPIERAWGLGDLLRRFRTAAGLTQEELAERAGLSARALSDLERGLHRAPHRDTLQRLAQALRLEGSDHAALLAAARRPLPRQQPTAGTLKGAFPLALTNFVGREREIGEVKRLLDTTRLLTLTGTGGVGKTRLALEAAGHRTVDFPDGVWLVELAALREARLVPDALAQALGVREQPGSPLLNSVIDVLKSGQVLILLDNCEHLVAAAAALAAQVLRACPGVRFLATSREPLAVPGEVIWRVPSLSFSDADGHTPALDDVLGCDAVRLFSERASTARPGWTVSQANAADVVHICRRLDGIPLAIELAAAWVRLLSAREIATRLDERFRLLVGGSPMQPERHQTLVAAMSWSYDLLRPEEQLLFERLSVFSGGFSLAAVESVCADATSHGIVRSTILELVSRLVDRSLVVAEPRDEELETRYRLLETLRAYAWECLQARGEADLVCERRAAWLVGLAEQAACAWHGPQQGQWLRWAEREHGNVRAAVQWAIEREDTDTALRLGAALWYAWSLHLRWSEGRVWLERVLALANAQAPTATRARALLGTGMLASFLGDLSTAQAYLDQAIMLALEVSDPFTALGARSAAAVMSTQFKGQHAPAREEVSEILERARRMGYTWVEILCLDALALAAASEGDHAQASDYLQQGERLARGSGDAWSLAHLLVRHGDVARSLSEHALAGQLYTESQAVFAELGLWPDPGVLHNLGYVALSQGDTERAAVSFGRALELFRRVGDRRGVAACLVGVGCVQASDARFDDAARLFGAGQAALDALGSQLWPSDRADYEVWLDVSRAGAASPAFDAAWSEGRTLPLDQAIARALAALPGIQNEVLARPKQRAPRPLKMTDDNPDAS